MPCYDPIAESQELAEESRRRREQIAKLEAMLCGTLTLLTVMGAMDKINYKKTGISEQEYRHWWRAHCKRDFERSNKK